MARVLLHVGGHKTATSFLQGTFHRNRALLARHGVHYPDIGPNDAHHALGAVWLATPDIPASFWPPGGPARLWDDLARAYAGREGCLVLSAENLSRAHPQRVDMADLARRLSPFEGVTVAYALRQQVDLIPSLWAQVARDRRPPALRPYVARALAERMGGGVPVDHAAVYDHLLTGFAPEDIRLLDYAAFRDAPGGVPGTFLRLAGSTLDPARLLPAPPGRANVSPPPLALHLASLVRPGGPPPPDLVARIAGCLDGPTTLLMGAEHARAIAAFDPLNAALARRVQPLQPGFALRPAIVPPGLLFRDELGAEAWVRIAAALYDPPAPSRGPLGAWRRLRGR